MSGCTPSQTVGPFFHFGLIYEGGGTLAPATAPGRITIEGRIVDGAGSPVPDAFLEIWQADAQGRYRAGVGTGASAGAGTGAGAGAAEGSEGFDGFGRAPTDATGRFVIETIKPGAVPGPEGRMQAPHLLLGLFGRGLLTQLITRLYFEDETGDRAGSDS